MAFRFLRNVANPAIAALSCVSLLIAVPLSASAQSYTFKTILSFNGTNGIDPQYGLTMDSAGNLYGATAEGGNLTLGNGYGDGTVFKIAAGTGVLSTIATFNGANGAGPNTVLTQDASGNLYGTTVHGGNLTVGNGYGDGTVFKIAAGTGVLTTIATFNGANGANPYGSVILDSSGNLYGTTNAGGANGYGTVYKISAGTGVLSTIATFNSANGAGTYAGLTLDSSGNLYGTAYDGGAYSGGTVFKIAANTGLMSTIVNFSYPIGVTPFAGLTLDSSGNLYGTTYQGGQNNHGTVFEITAGTGVLNTLASFNGTNGAWAHAGITLDSSGNLYGTTSGGGAGGYGTVYKIAAKTGVLSVLYTFTGSAYPTAGLTIDSSGNLYGTTEQGGTYNDGTVFELTP